MQNKAMRQDFLTIKLKTPKKYTKTFRVMGTLNMGRKSGNMYLKLQIYACLLCRNSIVINSAKKNNDGHALGCLSKHCFQQQKIGNQSNKWTFKSILLQQDTT